jgi:glycerol kinase
MANPTHVLALDQGTTSTRAAVFDRQARRVAMVQRELRQIYPQSGWVEHDPEEIWLAAKEVLAGALHAAGITANDVLTLGITNQRETVVVWDRVTGKPVHNAIVWQDRRTAGMCTEMVATGLQATIQHKTGLVIDAYFSASKIRWLLDTIPGLRQRAIRGDVLAGTIDSFLVWRLTGGQVHATDATNAARTMLFNIHTLQWDDDLLRIWGIPEGILPEVRDCNAQFGSVDPGLIGVPIPITGVAGDQHAAMTGQACFQPGMTKCTYGTGAFLLLNTGERPVESTQKLLTTLAYQLNGQPAYALEGSIFSAGSAVQWLRDGLKILESSGASQVMASGLASNGGVYLVPAFTGLGAPYWDPDARAAVTGVSRDTGPEHLVRAALEAVGYQTLDLLQAMDADGATPPLELRVDGGMVSNDWLCQFIADMAQCPVQRPEDTETTVRGAAQLAGLGAGLYDDLDALANVWQAERTFQPAMQPAERDRLYDGWTTAVQRVLTR